MPNDEKKQRWLGFDLGGTKMLAVVLDGEFKKLSESRKKTKTLSGDTLERISIVTQDALTQAGMSAGDLSGIGFGLPGPLDLDAGVVLEAPNLGWKNLPLRQRIEDLLGCRVVLANDVDAGCYGEYQFGAGRRARCVLGIFPGTGIGGACVYEGRLLRGTSNSCMEIGHMKIDSGGRLCGCGRRGCLETVASRLAIAADAAAAVFRGEAPWLAEHAGTDLAQIRSRVLAASIAAKDTAVEKIVRDAASAIGWAASNAVNLLAPDVVVLGGGLVEAMPDLFVEEVKRAAEANVMKSFVGGFQVKAAKLGDDATVLGAAALAAFPDALRRSP